MGFFEHVAIAVDFSEPSQIALRGCRQLLDEVTVQRVTLFHALKQVVLPHGDVPKVRERLELMRAKMHKAATEQLGQICKDIAWPEGVDVRCEVVEGNPARAVPIAAQEAGATVLLIGTHSRKGLRRWLQGSVAERVAEGTRIPVLVMPMGNDGVAPEAELADLGHVLVAVDVHREAAKVVRGALEAAVSFHRQKVDVTLLTVAELPDFPTLQADEDMVTGFLDALSKDAEAQLEGLEAEFGGDVANLRHEVRVGDPDEQILNAANEFKSRIVVLGTHGRDEAPLLQLGSTTAYVIRNADVSVLVIPSHPDLDA
ncbi:MAG: universal stress protein [Deltaproteobacteria bacterium]|nr:universal stress protein [Deltaproteobacteria bacterium]